MAEAELLEWDGEAEVGQPVEQRSIDDAQLGAREHLAQALMDAEAECDVAGRVPVPRRICPDPETDRDRGWRRNRANDALPRLYQLALTSISSSATRRAPTCSTLENRNNSSTAPDHFRIALDQGKLVWMLQKGEHSQRRHVLVV